MSDLNKNFTEIIRKVEDLKKKGEIDLSMEEDLAIGVMNLISIEEHLFFTGSKTKKDDYFDWLKKVRDVRKELLAKLVDKHEGETWCTAKHLLAATMRLIEVGTKLKSDGKEQEAKDILAKAYEMFSIFWALRLKLISLPDIKKLKESDEVKKPWTYQDLVEKLVDCCDE
jgi:hypothetical protein